ncbi:MAG: nicotinamide riboside transporter PnuC [Flavobacteriaceae bacterium]
MDTIIDFFLEPYLNASVLNISLELIAAVFGVISVFYAKKENILVYPTGIISTGIYVYLLSQWALYGDLIINIYYTLMSLYGWFMWTRVSDGSEVSLQISRTNKQDKLKAFAIFVFTAIFVIVVYRYYEVMPDLSFSESISYVYQKISSGNLIEFRKATPYIDTFTTAAAFVAMWLMANKKIENWTFWIVTNVVSIPLYFVKGYGLTGIQYFIFLVLAFLGYNEWKKTLNKKKQAA